MSAPGTLSNYYVDSFLVAEGDELAAPRYAPAPLGPPPPPRPAGLAEHPELAPCSFQPKAPVFGPPWSPAHPAGASGVPAVYHHPYAHHQAPPDGRYMRSWLEPVPGSLSFPGLPTGRHYGIKPEPLAARRADCTTFDTHTLSLSDYACGSPPVDRDKQSHEGAFSESNGESEANGEKPQIDPSKWDCGGNGLQGAAPAAGRCRGAGANYAAEHRLLLLPPLPPPPLLQLAGLCHLQKPALPFRRLQRDLGWLGLSRLKGKQKPTLQLQLKKKI